MTTEVTVAGFVTGVSADSISFTWLPPVETGTTVVLKPTAYVLCYSFASSAPVQNPEIGGALYEQFNMELLTELSGNTTSYNLFTTNPDFYQDAWWGIYPIFDGTAGHMYYAATYEGSAGFNRLELNEPNNMAIDTTSNDIYFVHDKWFDEDNLAFKNLIGKLAANKSLTHINGDFGILNTSSIYKNVIAVNSNTNKLIRLGGSQLQQVSIYDLNNNTKELDYNLGNVRIIFGLEPFVWNNRFFVMNQSTNDGNAAIGIFEIDTSLPTFTVSTGLTRTLLNTYAGEAGAGSTWYDVQVVHPTAFVDVQEGQAISSSSSGGLVMSKINSTTIVIKSKGSSPSSISFGPVKWHIARLGKWGEKSGEGVVGTATQPINTEYWNTVIPESFYSSALSTIDNNNLITAKRNELRIINLQNKTISTSVTTGLPSSIVDRTTIGGNGAAKTGYVLQGSKVYKLSGSAWTLFAQAPSGTYFNDIIWSVEDNCFYATQRIGNVGATYDIKKITVDGLVLPIEVEPENARGEDKKPTDGDGDVSGGLGNSLGNNGVTADIPEPEDVPKEIIVTDPDGEVIAVVPVVGAEPNTVITFRKLVDKFYLLQDGKIIWTYLLSPRELYRFTSTGYIGWIDRVTREPIYTPPEFLSLPTFDSLYYVLDAVLEEPGYSKEALFDGYPNFICQRLVIFEDDSFYIDRVNIEDDMKIARLTFESGLKYTIAPGVEAPSPLLPRWAIDIIGASDYHPYIKEVQLDG